MFKVKQITGRHVLIWLLSAFGVVTAVNLVFIYLAVSGFPGLDTGDSYRKGLAYNTQISRGQDIRALGWRVDVTLAGDRTLEISFADKSGAALPVWDVTGILTHPADAKADKPLELLNPKRGLYTTRLDEEAKGNWTVRIAATGPDQRPIEQRQKLWLE